VAHVKWPRPIRKLLDRPRRVTRRHRRTVALDAAGVTARIRVDCGADDYLVTNPDQQEVEQLATLLELLKPDDVVYEVGAHIGLWTVFLAQRASCVHAFEPEPANRAQLEANLLLNELDNVRVHPEVVADRAGPVEFGIHNGARRADHSLVPLVPPDRTITMEAVTLDDVATRPAATVLKIDVEGAEGLVLAGARAMLADPALRLIYVEIHPAETTAIGWPPDTVRELLQSAGFERARTWERLAQRQWLFSRGHA